MCGIIGYFSTKNDFNPGIFAGANNIVKYRGPDSYGYLTIKNDGLVASWRDEELKDFFSEGDQTIGALGFRRLSILDLSSLGNQPMTDREFRYWIIFNGEIYNYIELRDELNIKGLQV